MRLCHAIKALTDSAVPTAPLRYPSRAVASPRARPSRPRRPLCPKLTTSLSKRRASVQANHRRCPAASVVVNSSTVSGAPSTPLAAFSLWIVEPSFLSSSTLMQDHHRPPEPSLHYRTPPPIWFSPPSPSVRNSGELSPQPTCPAGGLSAVGARAPSFAPPPPW
jgi:hypothetical protein